MQPPKNTAIDSRNRTSGAVGKSPDTDLTGEKLAQLFSYYSQPADSESRRRVAYGRVPFRKLYAAHKKAFDQVADFFRSHNIKARPYIEFFVKDLGKRSRDIDEWLYSKPAISQYAGKLQTLEKKRKIYEWFQKSVDNIVDMCISDGYMSGKDCVLFLIRSNRLAQEYVTGRISKYFLAAMPNFRKIIPKLDHFAKAEFQDLYGKFDIYNTEINDVFLKYRNRVVNPFKIIDAELARRREASKK